MRQKKLLGIFSAMGIFLLILDGKTAIYGASQGIDLCIRTVIPSLFPFFLLSGILCSSLMGTAPMLLRPVGKFLRLPTGTESLLIPAFLGGYPAGAKAIGEAYGKGILSEKEACRLLYFGSNAGPAFLFGMVSQFFTDPSFVWILWAIHIGGALFLGAMLPGTGGLPSPVPQNQSFSLSESMRSALNAMAAVCGWVVLFKLILAFLSRWFLWRLAPEGQALFSGILELTNGTAALGLIQNPWQRFCLSALLLGFGGLCVTMQTASVLAGLPIRNYLLGRVFQAVFGVLFALAISKGFWPSLLALTLLAVSVGKLKQKSSGNSLTVGV